MHGLYGFQLLRMGIYLALALDWECFLAEFKKRVRDMNTAGVTGMVNRKRRKE
jgi:hypothetical protein